MTHDLVARDKLHRSQALDASASFIVQAPAGSGKTELLIQRFLTLLTHVKAPEEILAITFTKKAASEMRLRVLKALKQASHEPEPMTEHAKATWCLAQQVLKCDQQYNWHIIDNPNQLRIQTIDSLCAYLTKQLPLLSRFGSQPDIADNPVSLYKETVREVLMHVEGDYEWSEAIANLLRHLDNDINKLHDLFINLLAKRDQWLPYIHFENSDNEMKRQLEHQVGLVISDHLQYLQSLFPKELISELMIIIRFACDQLVTSNAETDLLHCRDLMSLPGNKPEDLLPWRGLSQLLLTKSHTWRKQLSTEIGFPPLTSIKNAIEKKCHTEARQQLTELLIKFNDHEDLRLALSELAFLPEPYFEDKQWNVLRSMLSVLKILAAQLRLVFQQHGQIDFIENAHAALLALGQHDSPTDLALALDYQIRHLLVDEFQDTSYTQYQLIEKLTMGWDDCDGRTLFIVGDPMQSIYRFREAEVGLFIRMRTNGIGNIKLRPLTLALNFRSTADIVEWNNRHFKQIFPQHSDIATGAVNYSPSAANQSEDSAEVLNNITVYGLIDANVKLQAASVVNLIKITLAAHPHEKIAVLVRSRSHLAAIIPALMRAEIPFKAVDIDPLASRQHIQDLLSLTCALLNPADRIAWLAILRSPWCGLKLADLLNIAGTSATATIYELCERKEILNKLSVDGKIRLAKLFTILKVKFAERDRYDIRSWIENAWLLLGGPACLQSRTDLEDTKAYFALLDNINHINPLLNIEKFKEKISRLFATTQQDEASVQIMTIHTAKGLEFDTVILPHLERKMPHDDKSLLLWMERPLHNDQLALLLAPIHANANEKHKLYDYIHRQQKVKSDYEVDRLFYVATTRAKRRMYAFFNSPDFSTKTFTPESGSFLRKLWPYINNSNLELIQCQKTEIAVDSTTQTNLLRRVSSDWQNPINAVGDQVIVKHQKQTGFRLVDNKPRIIGIVTHKILQMLAMQGIAWWQNKTSSEHHDYITQLLRQQGMSKQYIHESLNRIETVILNSLNDSRGKWILDKHVEAKSEFPLTIIHNDKAQKLVIDRTFIAADGTRWIIDYKTTTFSRDDLQDFLENEQDKYLEKMRIYHDAMKLLETRPIKLGLYFPALPAWKEWVVEVTVA